MSAQLALSAPTLADELDAFAEGARDTDHGLAVSMARLADNLRTSDPMPEEQVCTYLSALVAWRARNCGDAPALVRALTALVVG